MKIISAEFIKSAVKPDQYPKTGMPEIAFTGRSNVGKSSLINTLLGRKKLAQTSATPGKTRLINFFTVNEKLSFVDLPGYGFAKVSRAEQEKWGPMIETYLRERVNLRLVVSILDVRHDPTQQDRDLIEWLRHYGRNHLIVLTKSDKLSRGEALRRRRQIAVSLGLEGDDAPPFISDKYSDPFINMPIFRAFARRKATTNLRSMQRNTACPFSGDNIVIPWRAYNRRKGQNDSHAPSGRRVDGTSRIGDRLLLLKQNRLDCLPDFTLPFAALGCCRNGRSSAKPV
jgi:GTP-binding protein